MSNKMKRVVVIGAGPAGLAALRSLLPHRDRLQFVAYETSDRVGGTWIVNDPHKPTSMYEQLKTNLPKECMAYPGFPFSSDIYESFLGHKEVLDYLETFAQHYKLQQYIKFRHSVVEVDPVGNGDGETQWNVTAKDCVSGTLTTASFDSVFVCNGHYSEPLLPDIAGQATFTGEIIHSNAYRSPLNYKGKIVLVLGGGPSGVDISADLSPHVSKVYLSHNLEQFNWGDTGNLVQVKGIEKIAGDDIMLKDGAIVHADVILLATGYKFSLPFLSKTYHPSIEDDTHISPIYKSLVDINYPSLFYIGLNKRIAPFPQFAYQCEYAVACITGQIAKTRDEMKQDYDEQRNQTMKAFGRLKSFHTLGPLQWMYNNELAVECGLPCLPSNVERLYKHVSTFRKSKGMFKRYKQSVYRLSEDGEQFLIISEPELDS